MIYIKSTPYNMQSQYKRYNLCKFLQIFNKSSQNLKRMTCKMVCDKMFLAGNVKNFEMRI